jgi:lipopolysaccharide transport system ATP-binding protein
MSSDVVIRAEGLGKKYLIGHQSNERYTALRDVMAQAARNFARTTRDILRGKALVAGDEVEEFWALKDINFEIKRGDVVGIIGRNGAGKSTLLKVLSRITEPSEGRVTINGRVASLLEVGTGFHPELSGRENIYLNGAILGMNRAEINRKFDEIVDFSDVEKFLDTPVKRYSSGMYVRLAFAVAAHLEPEILIVDEVLAVGDAEFQKKCLGKMKDVSGQGRTVLFVSHNMAAVQSLCEYAMVLKAGKKQIFARVEEALTSYSTVFSNPDKRKMSIRNGFGIQSNWIQEASTIDKIHFEIRVVVPYNLSASLEVIIGDIYGMPIVFANTSSTYQNPRVPLCIGENTFRCTVDAADWATGRYTFYSQLSVPGESLLAKEENPSILEHLSAKSANGLQFLQSWHAGHVCRELHLTET